MILAWVAACWLAFSLLAAGVIGRGIALGDRLNAQPTPATGGERDNTPPPAAGATDPAAGERGGSTSPAAGITPPATHRTDPR